MKMMLLVILILQIVILLHLPYERLTANFKRLFRTKNSKDSTAPEKNPAKYHNMPNKPLPPIHPANAEILSGGERAGVTAPKMQRHQCL